MIGFAHQAAMRLSPPARALTAPPTRANFTTSHRDRLTLWVQARRKVPVSSSLATRGAEEDAEQRRGDNSKHIDGVLQRAVRARRVAGLGVVDVHEVRSGDCQHDRHDDKRRRGDDGFDAELAPSEADHEGTPTRDCRLSRSLLAALPM